MTTIRFFKATIAGKMPVGRIIADGTSARAIPEKRLSDILKTAPDGDKEAWAKELPKRYLGSYFWAELASKPKKDTRKKHLAGQHDQSTHGNRGEGARAESAEKLEERGGFTYSLSGKQPKEGLALSPYKDRETKIPFKEFSEDDLKRFEKRNDDLLSKPDHYVGGWHNTEDGYVYLDVSIVVDTRDRAEDLARQHSQLAYYDLGKGEVVNVGKAKAFDPNQPRDERGRWEDEGSVHNKPLSAPRGQPTNPDKLPQVRNPARESAQTLGVSVRFGEHEDESFFDQHSIYPQLIAQGASPAQANIRQLEEYKKGKEQLKLDTDAALKTAHGAGWPLPKAVGERSWATFSNENITGRYDWERDEIDVSSSAVSVYNTRRVRNFEEGWWVQPNTVLHELAHQAHHKANPGLFERSRDRSPERNLTREERSIAAKVSLYAQSDRLEFVAETACGLALGKDYDKDVLDLYKRLGGPTIRGRILSKGGIAPIPKR
jgi:hypothetical protein